MNDDGTINLRETKNFDEQPEFKISRDPKKMGPFAPKPSQMKAEAVDPNVFEASDKVKVKFDKFVNLIATHAYEDVVDRHKNQDIILSTNLLTDLANSFEEADNKKAPVKFMVFGLLIGVIITWIILKT